MTATPMTVSELLSFLVQLAPDRPCFVIYDGGTTFGPLVRASFNMATGDVDFETL